MLMPGMSWGSHHFQELLEPQIPPTSSGGQRCLPSTNVGLLLGIRRLNRHHALPVVPHVINIREAAHVFVDRGSQPDRLRAGHFPIPFGIRNAVEPAVDLELTWVAILHPTAAWNTS